MAFTLRTTGNYGIIGYRTVDNYGGPKIFDIYNNVNLHGFRIVNAGDPVDPQDYATKSYVDIRSAGLDPKESCLYTTVSNIANFTVKATVEAALDPVATITPVLANNNRVLVKNQTTTTENGIYWWQDSSASLVRAPDMNGDPPENVSAGNYSFVEQGDAWANTGWVVQGVGVLTLGVDPILFYLFSALPTGSNVGTGTGLVFRDIVGQNFNFRTLTGGTDIGIVTAGDNITISSTAAGVTLSTTGTGADPVSDSVGPALSVKSFVGGTDIGISSSATELTINNTRAVSSISNAGAGSTLIVTGAGPAMSLKSISAGSGISLTPAANDITIAASPVTPVYATATYQVGAVDGDPIAATTFTLVPINNTVVESGGATRVGSLISLPTTGSYSVSGECCLDDQPGASQLSLRLNGAPIRFQNHRDQATGTGGNVTITTIIEATAGDVLNMYVYTNTACRFGTDAGLGLNVYASLTAILL